MLLHNVIGTTVFLFKYVIIFCNQPTNFFKSRKPKTSKSSIRREYLQAASNIWRVLLHRQAKLCIQPNKTLVWYFLQGMTFLYFKNIPFAVESMRFMSPSAFKYSNSRRCWQWCACDDDQNMIIIWHRRSKGKVCELVVRGEKSMWLYFCEWCRVSYQARTIVSTANESIHESRTWHIDNEDEDWHIHGGSTTRSLCI